MKQRIRVNNTGRNSSIIIGNGNVVSNSDITISGTVSRIVQSRGTSQVGKFLIDRNARTVMIGDKEIPFHPKMKGENILAVDNHVIIDGYKLVDGEWKSIQEVRRAGFWSKIKGWFTK